MIVRVDLSVVNQPTKMEGKTLRQTLVSLDTEEKRMLKSFRLGTKALKMKQQENTFKKLCNSRNHSTGSQEGVQLEVGQWT